MTARQIEQVRAQLPEGETLNRMYRAIEGDVRVISRDKSGNEYRYTVRFDENDDITIKLKP